MTFLEEISQIPEETTSVETFQFPPLNKETIILLNGGGNFGDLWRISQDFRLKIVQKYPNNKIIIFPQSVFYEDKSLVSKDAEIMNKHQNLFICARDNQSYNFLKKNFTNKILLVPDMAFYINPSKLKREQKNMSDRFLYLKRLDKESSNEAPINIGTNFEVRDWPTIEKRPLLFFILYKILGLASRLDSHCLFYKKLCQTADYLELHHIKAKLINEGSTFVSRYPKIVTTRLHTLILACLLNIPVEYIESNSKKISTFADTWLGDCKNVRKYSPNNQTNTTTV